MLKLCNCCEQELPLSIFTLRKDTGKHRNECNPCRNKKYMERYRSDEDVRTNHRKNSRKNSIKQYGISVEDFTRMFDEQGGKCAICSTEFVMTDSAKNIRKIACVDHCHLTGKVRNLLCRNCNSGLGHFKDDKSLLQKAIEYLELHK